MQKMLVIRRGSQEDLCSAFLLPSRSICFLLTSALQKVAQESWPEEEEDSQYNQPITETPESLGF